jgi:CheY-like chemotaxis protein
MRARMRVLICDDNHDAADTLGALCRVLLPAAEVEVCYSGRSCIDRACDWPPNLVLLDIGMPEMSGYDVAREIRKLAQCGATVIAAVSGWASKLDREQSSAAGCDFHFSKPLTAESLVKLLGI